MLHNTSGSRDGCQRTEYMRLACSQWPAVVNWGQLGVSCLSQESSPAAGRSVMRRSQAKC